MTSDFAPRHDRAEWDRATVLDRSGEGFAHSLGAWEAVYRDYVSASARADAQNRQDRQELAQVSARVAVTWRRLARAPGLDWWLVAAFSTAAEAMEQQARDWGINGRSSL